MMSQDKNDVQSQMWTSRVRSDAEVSLVRRPLPSPRYYSQLVDAVAHAKIRATLRRNSCDCGTRFRSCFCSASESYFVRGYHQVLRPSSQRPLEKLSPSSASIRSQP